MAKYTLSPEAQKSLSGIKAYSIKEFGSKKTNSYLQSIRKRMLELAENPSRGIIREDLNAQYHSDFVESHTIYYRIQPNKIEIMRMFCINLWSRQNTL